MSTKVVLVDDHILIAKAISSIINDFEGFEVLYEVENGKKLIERFQHQQPLPDIVLLDISMPVMNGFDTAQWLKENHPNIKVMALSMNSDEDSLIKMVKNGARGYLQKNIHPMELHTGLNKIKETGYYFPDATTFLLMRSVNSDKADHHEPHISKRESEFLKFVCTELTYKEIAEKMFCSPRTVESYRDSLFEKLGLKTRVGLALYAVKTGHYVIGTEIE
ncbi:MAG: response regulator transcription factor [Saprospiraceae bacterium]|nr:response regulator transcription factor [Saprospiraceae bacterium]